MTTKRKREIKKHVNKQLKKYSSEVMKLAIENDHPWISVYLTTSLYELKRDIAKNQRTILGTEEILF